MIQTSVSRVGEATTAQEQREMQRLRLEAKALALISERVPRFFDGPSANVQFGVANEISRLCVGTATFLGSEGVKRNGTAQQIEDCFDYAVTRLAMSAVKQHDAQQRKEHIRALMRPQALHAGITAAIAAA